MRKINITWNWNKNKRSKKSKHWLNQSSTSSRYPALLEEENEDHEHESGPENTPEALHTNIEQALHSDQPHQKTSDIGDLEKPFWTHGSFAKPCHYQAY
jgi:hypothetical protein